MEIITNKISKEFTDNCNMEAIISAAQKMIKEEREKDSVKLSLNLLDPDIYEIEYSNKDHLMCIVRKGTSITEDNAVIGSTGLIETDELCKIEEGVRDILGLNRKTLTYSGMGGIQTQITVSKGWWMMQDENEDIASKAFADVNASLVQAKEPWLQKKICELSDMQRNIRECRTAHPSFDMMVCMDEYLYSYRISFKGKHLWTCENTTALLVTLALTKGYINAKSENTEPENIGQLIDVFDDFLEERGIVVESSVNEMVESGEYSRNDAENGTFGNRCCIYGSDYDELANGLRKVLSA